MWCSTRSSTCSVGESRNSRVRSGGSTARSKPVRVAADSAAGSSAAVSGTVTRPTGASSAARIRCRETPSWSGKTVRRTSCRSTTSRSAASSAAGSSSPDSRRASGMLYAPRPPSSRLRNHNRCWAGESGITAGRSAGTSAGRAAPAVSSRATRPAGVGVSKTARSGSSTPNAERTALLSRVASRLCPPSWKKPSSGPAEGTESTWANSSPINSSRGSRGRTRAERALRSGAGRAARSSLPLEFIGSASSRTNALGTMYSGREATACAAISATVVPLPGRSATWATSRRSPVGSATTPTALLVTAGWRVRTFSISPGSIRKPRTLTWSSVRPR